MTKKSAITRYVFFQYDPCFERGEIIGHGHTISEVKKFLRSNPGSWVRDFVNHETLTIDSFKRGY